MMRHRVITIIAAAGLTGCSVLSSGGRGGPYRIEPLASSSDASLRGISVVSADVAWASGTRGTVLRTTDGGAS
ncbi:MAG TPA: hypothetical protein VF021_10950, partial [Longimicrobiales bacterium]